MEHLWDAKDNLECQCPSPLHTYMQAKHSLTYSLTHITLKKSLKKNVQLLEHVLIINMYKSLG